MPLMSLLCPLFSLVTWLWARLCWISNMSRVCSSTFNPPTKVSCSTYSLRGEERQGWISVALSLPYPFFLSHLCSRVCDLELHPLYHALHCLLCLFVKHCTTTTEAMTLLCLWETLTVYETEHVMNVQKCRTFTQPHLQKYTFAHAYLPIKWCCMLGWPLNGFDTHYQLSLMWN